jgi:hypothetical protein
MLLARRRDGSRAVSERKTLGDLGMVTVDFGWSDAEAPEPGNTFRLSNKSKTFAFLASATIGKVWLALMGVAERAYGDSR